MDNVRWGIIGCGDVTEVKSGPAFGRVEGSELVAVMRRDGAKAEDYARRHGVRRSYNDADDLIHDDEVNAVYIATPPDSHAHYTARAAAAGKPVYVEKPMARNFGECQRMMQACEAAGVPLFVAYYRRCLPAFLKVRELVTNGALGQIRFATLQLYQELPTIDPADLPWRVRPAIAGAGLFFDLGSHMLDFLDFTLGPVVQVQGLAVNQGGVYKAEDVVCAYFQFETGVVASGTWCFGAGVGIDRTEIVGSAGRVVYSTFAIEPVVLETSSGVETFHFPPPQHIQQPLIETVVGELRGTSSCPSTGRSAARTSRIMDDIVASYYRAEVQR